MREGGEWAEVGLASAGPAAGSQSSCGGARAFPLRGDLRRHPLSRLMGTWLRGPPQPASLGESARLRAGRSRLGCSGGRPVPPAPPGSAQRRSPVLEEARLSQVLRRVRRRVSTQTSLL